MFDLSTATTGTLLQHPKRKGIYLVTQNGSVHLNGVHFKVFKIRWYLSYYFKTNI